MFAVSAKLFAILGLSGMVRGFCVSADLGSTSAQSCPGTSTSRAREDHTSLMQMDLRVRKPIAEPATPPPFGRTFLSLNPSASAAFLLKYYGGVSIPIHGCASGERAAVMLPDDLSAFDESWSSVQKPEHLIIFIRDDSLPISGVNVSRMVRTMASAFAEPAYLFQFDNHDGWKWTLAQGAMASMASEGVNVVGFYHTSDIDPTTLKPMSYHVQVQIPHTMQTIQTFFAAEDGYDFFNQSWVDDCRANAEPDATYDGAPWWKTTFAAADPTAAVDFVLNVLGGNRLGSPYTAAEPGCTFADWMELLAGGFQLHFVYHAGMRGSASQISEALNTRNLTQGQLDQLMLTSLMFRVASLDPYIQRLEALGTPFLLARADEAEVALLVSIPWNEITIQLRSGHVSAAEATTPDLCVEALPTMRR